MQIIELYIRDGIRYYGNATSTSADNLVDANADFTSTVKVGYIAFNEVDGTSAKITAITNSTTLALSDNIFTVNEAYVIKSDYERLDLFEDESVSITDSIKNVKDVAKIFTPFSQQFNIPASKHNSKIIRHYEDSDVLNSFDARYKADALIKLNGSDYKKGKIRLNSVSLKNNKPHAYKLIFFGETVGLKDILGETMLSGLNYDSSLNFTYSHAVIYPKFTSLADVCFPLITHTKNMRYNSNSYRSTPDNEKLNYRDLKPAIKVRKIIDAIENTFDDINFSGEFFNTTDFNSLYMWMHREKGFMSNADEGGGLRILENIFHLPTDTGLSLISGNELRPVQGTPPTLTNSGVAAFLVVTITTSSTSDTFDFRAEHALYPSVVYVDTTGNTGSTSYTFTVSADDGFYFSPINARLLLTSTNTFTISSYEIEAFRGATSSTYESDVLSVANTVIIGRQMPKMKTIDFLTNMFKMFNLVAYKVDDTIRVVPLNDYYSEGLTYDITKYVDTTKNSISKVLQYKNIEFNFPNKESFLVKKSDELQGANFAGESYGDVEWDGTDYKIEPVFEKMLYERLSDEHPSHNTLTTICQGAMLDKDFNATIGKPLLLYIANQIANPTFHFANADGGSDETVSTYNRPSQILIQSDGSVLDASSSLNFGVESDEFFLDPRGTNLLQKYYLDYVQSVFDRQARINKVDAYLPLHIILKYDLNDKFVIGNKTYRINTIKTNLLNNKSSLELYSLSQEVTAIENSQTSSLPRLAALNVTGKSSSSISLGWIPAGALNTDNITGYDIYKDDTFVETLGNDISGRTLTGLDSGITYKLAIRTRYTISSTVAFSNDRIVYATTD